MTSYSVTNLGSWSAGDGEGYSVDLFPISATAFNPYEFALVSLGTSLSDAQVFISGSSNTLNQLTNNWYPAGNKISDGASFGQGWSPIAMAGSLIAIGTDGGSTEYWNPQVGSWTTISSESQNNADSAGLTPFTGFDPEDVYIDGLIIETDYTGRPGNDTGNGIAWWSGSPGSSVSTWVGYGGENDFGTPLIYEGQTSNIPLFYEFTLTSSGDIDWLGLSGVTNNENAIQFTKLWEAPSDDLPSGPMFYVNGNSPSSFAFISYNALTISDYQLLYFQSPDSTPISLYSDSSYFDWGLNSYLEDTFVTTGTNGTINAWQWTDLESAEGAFTEIANFSNDIKSYGDLYHLTCTQDGSGLIAGFKYGSILYYNGSYWVDIATNDDTGNWMQDLVTYSASNVAVAVGAQTKNNGYQVQVFNYVEEDTATTLPLAQTYDIGHLSFTQVIQGSSHKDTIKGTDNNDLIMSDQGRDVITGGKGQDVFLFRKDDLLDSEFSSSFGTGKDNVDIIRDFNPRKDTIALSRWAVPSTTTIEVLIVQGKKQARKAKGSTADVIYDSYRGFAYFNENGNDAGWGDGGLFAKLVGSPNLNDSNFMLG